MSAPSERPHEEPDSLAGLVERCAQGDRRAARALFDAVLPIFARVGRATLGPRDPDVQDFVQDAALRFFRGLHAFRGESRVRWFAFRIASHTATDWVRGRQALKRAKVGGAIPEDARADDDPRRDLRRRQLGALLFEALPEHQREAFLMRAVLGSSIEEIAAQTGVPINTVRSRLRRAKRALRERLGQDPELLALLKVSP